MSGDHEQKAGDFPAIGASGAIGILPNGYFAQKLSQPKPPSSPPAQAASEQRPERA